MNVRTLTLTLSVVVLSAGMAPAVSIDLVPIGNPGNAGEWSGGSFGGEGPNRVCGAVDYTYSIGKYEVTSGQYTEFLNAVAKTDTYGLYNVYMWNNDYSCKIQQSGSPGNYTYSVAPNYANRPVNWVSYWDACRFANWLHNGQPTGAQGVGTTETGAYTLNGYNGNDGRTIGRNAGAKWAVTSEDEWYKSAYYKGGGTNAGYWHFPTASDTTPGRDMADVSGNNANYEPYPIDPPYYTTVVGEFQNSNSPYGTFDQGGNVWEWTESIIRPDADDGSRLMRGGSFNCEANYMLASSRGAAWLPEQWYSTIGFRVVSVPEPGSITLLVCGAIAGLIWWKRRK